MTRSPRLEPLAAKVPEITLMFWVLKVLTTGMGKAMSDFLGKESVPIGGAIAVPGLAWWRGSLNPIVAFWSAYVITRPLGASVVDWLGKLPGQTGLGWGDGTVSGLALPVFVALVVYTAVTRRDIQPHRPHLFLRLAPASSTGR